MKHVIIGIDVGNSTTEAAMAQIQSNTGELLFLKSAMTKTTGTKGTIENVAGIKELIRMLSAQEEICIDKILMNDVAPVISDLAMETITETVITDSAMIGHNPDTPGGMGIGVGYTISMNADIPADGRSYIVVVPESWTFSEAAKKVNESVKNGCRIAGLIVQKDEGTLIHNRLDEKLPIVDEVMQPGKIPMNALAAVEVAPVGYGVEVLSDPYGIASVFHLNAKETAYCKYIAKALIGNRSAVVIKTPHGDIRERVIPAGRIEVIGDRYTRSVDLDSGADKIMSAIREMHRIVNIRGEEGTNIGGMLNHVRAHMAGCCNLPINEISISDLFATNTKTARTVQGGLSGEIAMEKGVAVAAMIHADQKFMSRVAGCIEEDTGIPVEVCGVEGEMAVKGALTTPGTDAPMVMVDIGAGSSDAAYIDKNGNCQCIHLAGAGNMITMLIRSELNLQSFEVAEQIKKYPLAQIDGLYRIKYENGNVEYRSEPFDVKYYGQTVAVSKESGYQTVDCRKTMEEIRLVRRAAKKKVMVSNIQRALEKLDVPSCPRIVLVGGSVQDFEMADIISEVMTDRNIIVGKGNIRGIEGPRNAVATGLIQSYYERECKSP